MHNDRLGQVTLGLRIQPLAARMETRPPTKPGSAASLHHEGCSGESKPVTLEVGNSEMQSDLSNRISPDPEGGYRVTDSNRFVSFWDMLHLQSEDFLSSLTFLSSAVGDFQAKHSVMDDHPRATISAPLQIRAMIVRAVQRIQETAEEHGLGAALYPAQQFELHSTDLLAKEVFTARDTRQLATSIETLVSTVIAEAKSRQFYVLSETVSHGFDNPDQLFAPEVVDAFPDAGFDMTEAGKCLSFGLWTASAMHTMRVLECGLKALARHVGVAYESNWNKVLNQIEARLREVRRSKDGDEAEAWAAEAGTHLRFIKNAWRNQAMHSGWRVDGEEARHILANARAFMLHLSHQLRSDGPDFTAS